MEDQVKRGWEANACETDLRRDARRESVLERARLERGQAATESIASRLKHTAARELENAVRHEELAQALTPEIERTLWCLKEAIELGVFTLPIGGAGTDKPYTPDPRLYGASSRPGY